MEMSRQAVCPIALTKSDKSNQCYTCDHAVCGCGRLPQLHLTAIVAQVAHAMQCITCVSSLRVTDSVGN